MVASENYFRISFCTTCMNRAHQVKETLPKNIEDNKDYPDLEFVLLDYNSTDDLCDWVKETLGDHIERGVVTYFRTTDPQFFHMSHAKNLSVGCASGDIVCNVDADNFTGPGFAAFLDSLFREKPSRVVAVDKKQCPSDTYGRIAVRRDDFMAIHGYDEAMEGHGFEDYDLVNRLKLIGLEEYRFSNTEYLQVLKHDVEQRIQKDPIKTNLRYLFMNYIDPHRSQFHFLFNDGTFTTSQLVNYLTLEASNWQSMFLEPSHERRDIEIEVTQRGTWQEENDRIFFSSGPGQLVGTLEYDDNMPKFLCFPDKKFSVVHDVEVINQVLIHYSQMKNRFKMRENADKKTIVVNDAFGYVKTLAKNFAHDNSSTI